MRKVYHGSTHIIERPLCHVGRDNLDFGKGFYVTNIKKQALVGLQEFLIWVYLSG